MTNEEKAIEIYNRETNKGFHLGTHSLVEMAEWKDQEYEKRVKKLEVLIKKEKEWQEKDCNHSWEWQYAYIEGLKKALKFFI